MRNRALFKYLVRVLKSERNNFAHYAGAKSSRKESDSREHRP